MLMGEK